MRLTESIEKKTYKYLNDWKINNCRILTGFSGGPDSSALLNLLKYYKEELNLTIICAYIDHGLRKKEETDKDVILAEEICKKCNCELYIIRIEQGKISFDAEKYGTSIEEEARKKRYMYLDKVRKKTGADYIALGHNYDDNIETVIMRFFQGANYTGLKGIPEKRDKIIRPLINSTKKEILSYLKKHNIEYRIDKTNLETEFLRNKIRNILIPKIKDVFPGFMNSIKGLSLKMKMISNYFEENTDILEDWIKAGKNEYKIKIKVFNKKPDIIRIQSVYRIYNMITGYTENDRYFTLPYRFLKPLNCKYDDNRVILRGYGIILYNKDGWLFFKRDVVVNNKKGYLININNDCSGVVYCANLKYKAVHINKKEEDMLSLDIKKVKLPVLIRSRIPGDYIITENGRKSIKKLFSEWKIHNNDRWKIPVISHKNEILCVLGKPFGFKNKYAKVCSFKYTDNRDKRYFNIIVNKIYGEILK